MNIIFASDNPAQFLDQLGRKGDVMPLSPIRVNIDYRSRIQLNNTALLLDCTNAGPFTCLPMDCHRH
jgi:hypothetical protein